MLIFLQFYKTFPKVNALRSQLNWSQYKLLIRIKNEDKRAFYITESIKNSWSGRELERQINSSLFERLLLSSNKEDVLVVPHSYTKRLANATEEELKEYRLIGNGRGIYFPLIDEDLSVEGIIRDFGNEVKRVNISLPVLFLDEIDSYAKEHHLSCSALLQKATRAYIGLG